MRGIEALKGEASFGGLGEEVRLWSTRVQISSLSF